MRRFCGVSLLLLGVTVFFAVSGVRAEGSAVKAEPSAWLRALPVPDSVKEAFSDKLRDLPPGEAKGWVASKTDGVYVLGVVPVPQDAEPELQISLDAEAQNRSSLKALTLLARHLTEGRLDRKKFEDEEATDYALGEYYRQALKGGVQSRSAVFGRTAYTLLWVEAMVKSRILAETLPEKSLTASYCEWLYRRGASLMEAGDCEGALRVFHKIHYLDWANVKAYLDAAECFLRVDRNDDGVRLARELLKRLETEMTAAEMARAGRLLFRGGSTNEGFAALEKACVMAGILTP